MIEQTDRFKLVAPFKPSGDQPEAIERLLEFIGSGEKYATLLGVTGSGKTFAAAKLDTWAFEHGLPPEPFARMKQTVIALFADMERKGEFD